MKDPSRPAHPSSSSIILFFGSSFFDRGSANSDFNLLVLFLDSCLCGADPSFWCPCFLEGFSSLCLDLLIGLRFVCFVCPGNRPKFDGAPWRRELFEGKEAYLDEDGLPSVSLLKNSRNELILSCNMLCIGACRRLCQTRTFPAVLY